MHRKNDLFRPLKRGLELFFLLMFFAASLALVRIDMQKQYAQEQFAVLAAKKEQKRASMSAPPGCPPDCSDPCIAKEEPMDGDTPQILQQYEQFAIENPDFAGWIQIEDTMIDYPVMHTPHDPEKYLNRDFQGNPSISGTPFLDARCNLSSDNLIVYGHNMKSGDLFATLLKYQEKEYCQEHPVIRFDTLYAEGEYEVLSAFYDRVYDANETEFKFYQFIDAANAEQFEQALNILREKSLYETGVDAEWGDQILTLVTCSYHTDNGRFVVVARKI